MNLDEIPCKTAKGRHEVHTRAYGIGARERSVLIMVDGTRSKRVLLAQLALVQRVDGILDELRSGGFITVGESEPLSIAVPSPELLPEALHSIRQYARRYVLATLGPRGEHLACKLDEVRSHSKLMQLLEMCRDLIALYAGPQKAQEFWIETELAVRYG